MIRCSFSLKNTHYSDSSKSLIPNMDLKTKVNIGPEYFKSLMFSKKENVITEIIHLLPYVKRDSIQSKTVIMKMLPVLFSYSELDQNSSNCLVLIEKIKQHPCFVEEKRLLKGWETRWTKICGRQNEFCENKFLHTPENSMSEVIGYSELDLFLSFNKWLKYHKLHKYLYFFANLSFAEIGTICDEQTIRFFEQKIDLHPMTDGARKAILRKLAELKQREARLEVFSQMEYFTSVSKVERAISEMKVMLKTPIRRNSMLITLLIAAIQRVISVIMKLCKEEFMSVHDTALSLLKLAWGCSIFELDVKNKLNMWQSILNSKKRSYSRRKTHQKQNRDVYAVHFDLENGMRAITLYLEKILQDDI